MGLSGDRVSVSLTKTCHKWGYTPVLFRQTQTNIVQSMNRLVERTRRLSSSPSQAAALEEAQASQAGMVQIAVVNFQCRRSTAFHDGHRFSVDTGILCLVGKRSSKTSDFAAKFPLNQL
jgi:hypothetical protein